MLYFFGISLPVLKIAGGLIVANTAWGMVTSHARITPEESHEAEEKEDISLTPLAMPLMSGPGAIGVVMALAAHVDSAASYIGMVIGIAGIALSVLLFFWLGGPLVRRLGPSAVGAINKIFGFLILAIAVQLGVGWRGRLQELKFERALRQFQSKLWTTKAITSAIPSLFTSSE